MGLKTNFMQETAIHIYIYIYILHQSINSILIRAYPHKRGWPIYPTLTAISSTPTLHLTRFMTSSFSKPTLLLSFSTCVYHVFFGCPRFFLHFTSNSNVFLKTCPSSLLNTCHTISLHSPLPSEPLFLQSQHLQ